MVPVAVAPARLVGAAAVRAALVAAGAAGAGRTVGPDVEVTTLAKAWPVGWVGGLVEGVTPGGFVALGIAGAQPVEVVAAGGEVVAVVVLIAAGIPRYRAAAILAPALLRLARTHTKHRRRSGQSHLFFAQESNQMTIYIPLPTHSEQ